MKVKILQTVGRDVQIVEARQIIVEDEADNPVIVISEVQPGVIELTSVDDGAEFQKILKGLGIDKIVTVEKIDPARLRL